MKRQVIKVRLYPNTQQKQQLTKSFGCCRWFWNYSLALQNQTYKETGKGLSRKFIKGQLPVLKKQPETSWLKDCYSQCLQQTALNLSTAFDNFFTGKAEYPGFKSRQDKQSIQYPQNVKVINDCVKLPGGIGEVKAKIHRPVKGNIKTVTVSMNPSGKYFASIVLEQEVDLPLQSIEGKAIGIALGLNHFVIISDGEKISKYDNPHYCQKQERNLARKLKKLARKQPGSNSRNKARRLVARVYERLSNTHQDFLHKLSRKLVNENQVIVVENLNVKGMVHHHQLEPSRSVGIAECDRTIVSWGIFVNLLEYKLDREGKVRPSRAGCHHQEARSQLHAPAAPPRP
ncbi:MAG: transposase, partial [Symploca sp. SIO2E6]|nr:transposase [Symploca sp. SIO2E6]